MRMDAPDSLRGQVGLNGGRVGLRGRNIQDINRQVRELQAAGAEEIITERVHGDAKVKPQLDFLLEHIEANEFIVVIL